MTATTKPVYRWKDCIGGSYLRNESNGFPVAEVYRDRVDEWHWRKIGGGESHTCFVTIAVAKDDCELALGVTTVQDQPPVIVPPDGFADALDAHAATVAEEDAEATDSKVRNSIQEARKKIWGDRIGEAEDAQARHASAMANHERPRGDASQPTADRAREIVHGRNGVYGKPERSQERIAKMWSAYLGVEVTAQQVCGCMTLLKMARLAETPGHVDSLVDAFGYLYLYEACGKAGISHG